MVQKALEAVDLNDCWDSVGRDTDLARNLGTKGTRATGGRAKERLKELWRWRNHLAHGGDEEIALSEAQLRDAIDFIRLLGAALDNAIRRHIKIP
jgi:HEPN superfamily RiboL-PSP-like protein